MRSTARVREQWRVCQLHSRHRHRALAGRLLGQREARLGAQAAAEQPCVDVAQRGAAPAEQLRQLPRQVLGVPDAACAAHGCERGVPLRSTCGCCSCYVQCQGCTDSPSTALRRTRLDTPRVPQHALCHAPSATLILIPWFSKCQLTVCHPSSTCTTMRGSTA